LGTARKEKRDQGGKERFCWRGFSIIELKAACREEGDDRERRMYEKAKRKKEGQ